MNGDDEAGHRILGDVNGGFTFIAEVAAHSFFPVCGGFDWILRNPLPGCGRVVRLPWVDRFDQPGALLRNAVGILRKAPDGDITHRQYG